MKRIAIVSPRYGTEVNDGSARYARQLAERLVERYEVDVFTTKAVDPSTWRNWYVRDIQSIRGVTVRRFNTMYERAQNYEAYTASYLEECREDNKSTAVEKVCIEKYGPYAPDCVRYLIHHKQEYDVIIYIGWQHYLTVASMPETAEKAVLVPLVTEDSPYFDFITYQQMFTMPRGFVFLTDEERMFVRGRFKTQGIPCEVLGTGVNVPDHTDGRAFLHKYRIRDPYIVYSGKVDEDKDCPMLFHYFMEYKRRNPDVNVKLVLMGKELCRIPEHEDIISLGYVSEQDKYNGIEAAEALVIPSQHENLPEALLSAMGLRVPVIVNGACESLKEHCVQSNGGLYYENFFEFEGALNMMIKRPDIRDALADCALRYVAYNHRWDVILDKFIELTEKAVAVL